MNALPITPAELDSLEEMRGNVEQVDNFLRDPNTRPNTEALVATFMGHGLPLRDKTRTDDALCSRYEQMRDSLTEEFSAWARTGSPSPLKRWMDEAQQESELDAALNRLEDAA